MRSGSICRRWFIRSFTLMPPILRCHLGNTIGLRRNSAAFGDPGFWWCGPGPAAAARNYLRLITAGELLRSHKYDQWRGLVHFEIDPGVKVEKVCGACCC